MPKFKVGDFVTDESGGWSNPKGHEIVKIEDGKYWLQAGTMTHDYEIRLWDDMLKLVEPAKPKSPVVEREVTITSTTKVKTIKSGVYGRIRVECVNERVSVGIDRSPNDTSLIKFGTFMHELTASELESAAQTFMELAKFLREKE